MRLRCADAIVACLLLLASVASVSAPVALVMRQAGLSYTLTREPVARALASLREGRYDADMLRLPQFDQLLPGAVRVDLCLLNAERAYDQPAQVNGVTLYRSVLARVNLHIWLAPAPEAEGNRAP